MSMTSLLEHIQLGLCSKLPQEYNLGLDNRITSFGLFLRSPFTNAPHYAYKLITSPRIVTVALTVLSLLAVQFAFYPLITAQISRIALNWVVKRVSYEHIHFGLYILSMTFVSSNGFIAFGRFSKSEVKDFLNRF
jgi:hypothetical protein